MQKKLLVSLAITTAISTSSAYAAEQAKLIAVDKSKAIQDSYIVVFKTPSVLDLSHPRSIADFAKSKANAMANKFGINIRKDFGSALNGVLVNATPGQLKDLLNDPSVDFIEQDQIMSVSPQMGTSAVQAGATWGLDRVDQRALPLSGDYNYNYDGSGVTAYVVDTGVSAHSDFGGRQSHGWDFVDNDADATDCHGHGTHVAGTIAGAAYGVAKNANIVGIRVLDCQGSGTNSGVISGVDWITQNATGPSVANMSLGGGASQALDNAVNNAVAAGITFVVAAGNDNQDACNYSPARAANAVTVGSTDDNDSRSSFSNFGSCLDIFAPGRNITSTWINGGTNTISGTSMASPHVAGVAAVYLSEDGTRTPAQIDALLSDRSTKDVVTDAGPLSVNKLAYSLTDNGGPGGEPVCGDTCMENGVAKTGLSAGFFGATHNYQIDVPAGQTLTITVNGSSSSAIAYANAGTTPTSSVYDCKTSSSGNPKTCTVNNTQATTYHVQLTSSWFGSYSGVSLTASF
ncbi:S8 family peptidase [Shewanella sp. D64]|uniref:S8 family peptidase n=1 Tax=unclassified Shewanella TaxID=196818 RepID=UPI0022BA6D27|nr:MULTISPECIES: S8 family peptidase [unclassified Shewanella]MEC4724062.1 S8 family peptidase [Shewanella sp. D64]MEC4736082.1 S8 family peptidase [Shewanella sp. E94]WBJ97974.1 S8 family peptidase [Shewanella sp. MTB7]